MPLDNRRPSGFYTTVSRKRFYAMVTIVDVARLAGVSVSTVSHVLNDTRPVRPETCQRVRAVIAETRYSPDGVARALRRAKTECIGLVVTDTGQPGFADMIRGVEQEARGAGFTLLLANSGEDREREKAAIKGLLGRRVDGLLLAQVGGSPHSVVESIVAQGVPVVLLDRLSTPDVDQVGVETVEPMKLLVRHLIELGHRQIGLVSAEDSVFTIRERRHGYTEALREAGLPEALEVVAGDIYLTATGARQAVHRLFAGQHPPTAIVAASQLLAVGALQAFAELGLAVPADVAMVVFDDFPYAELFTPRITCVAQPNVEIGREAARLLVRRMRFPDAPFRTVRLKPKLMHRHSCGCSDSASQPLQPAAVSR